MSCDQKLCKNDQQTSVRNWTKMQGVSGPTNLQATFAIFKYATSLKGIENEEPLIFWREETSHSLRAAVEID